MRRKPTPEEWARMPRAEILVPAPWLRGAEPPPPPQSRCHRAKADLKQYLLVLALGVLTVVVYALAIGLWFVLPQLLAAR